MPRGLATAYRPCAADAHAYVDEFFAANGLAEQEVDLSALPGDASLTYQFSSPLCVDDVRMTAIDMGGLRDATSDREVPLDADERMLLAPPQPEAGPEVFGAACLNASDLGGLFREDDVFNVSFSLVETYPSVLQIWP